MLKNTDEQLKDIFTEKSLSAEKLHDVLVKSEKSKRRLDTVMWAVAATLVLGVATMIMQEQWIGSDRTRITLTEASTNHVTKLQFEFQSESMAQLDDKMDKLPFALRLPESGMPELASMDVIKIEGARYCTISGNLAAHLKVVHSETRQQFSLFVTPDIGKIRSIADRPARINGVDVRLWREKGMFYALASTDQV